MTEVPIANLKNALTVAASQLKETVRRLAPKHVGGEIEAYEAASLRLLSAERTLAAAEKRPYALAEDCDLSWDTGAPLPTLLQSDHQTFLLFLLADKDTRALPDEDEQIGQIQFERCLSTSFGSPNDETHNGHPLYGSGFKPHTAMRVINSTWIAHLEKINSVHPRHNPDSYKLAKHFIFPFHDTTFECVAQSFTTSRTSGPLSAAVKRAVDHLF